MGLDRPTRVYDPGGCASCLGSGYRGRTGLFEALWMDDRLQRMVADNAGDDALRRATPGRTTLRGDGWAKVCRGVTTIDEVLSATVEA